MPNWLERIETPAIRHELHYGGRMIRCFADRPRNIHDMLAAAVAARPDSTALICGNRSLTYREFDRLVGRLAADLCARGVETGDRIAIILENSIEFVAVLFAVARLGAVSVPLNVRQQREENRHCLNDSGAKLVVFEDVFSDRIPPAADVPELRHKVALDRACPEPLAALLAEHTFAEAVRVDEDSVATILYTSGTTGRPKGAMLTHLSLAHATMSCAAVMRLSPADRLLCAVPMSHVTGLVFLVDATMHCQGTLIIMPAFKAADFIDLASECGMTFTILVPAMFNLCLLAPNFSPERLRSWRVGGYGGGIMPEITVEQVAQKLPQLKLIQAYGATETTGPAVMMPAEYAVSRKESVGLTLPCADVVVLDENGVEMPPGEPGEIHIGGAVVAPGYWGNPQASETGFPGGYWRSGDLGSKDADGFIRVIDRIKDVIVRGGYKIYAKEVEDVLLRHPNVIEAAVVSRPCEVLGERVHAFVVLDDAGASDAELREQCATRLSDYKVPEAFHRLDQGLPRNANGKVLKRDLREKLLSRQGD